VPNTSGGLDALGAAVVKRAGINPTVEHTGRGQEFGEEHDLSVRCGLGYLVPAHVHTAAHRVLAGLRQHRLLRFVCFTHRVIPFLVQEINNKHVEIH
jgi:hypothetical protein